MKKILLLLSLVFTNACAFAGTFEKIDFTVEQQKSLPKNSIFYSFTGSVEKSDEEVFKKLSKKHLNNLYLVIESNGGDFITGMLLGYQVLLNENHVIIDKAFSAAGMWALGDKKRVYLNDESELMLHLPYVLEADKNPELFMQLGCLTRDYLEEFFGLEEAKNLMSEMTKLRLDNGINAGIFYNKKGKTIKTKIE